MHTKTWQHSNALVDRGMNINTVSRHLTMSHTFGQRQKACYYKLQNNVTLFHTVRCESTHYYSYLTSLWLPSMCHIHNEPGTLYVRRRTDLLPIKPRSPLICVTMLRTLQRWTRMPLARIREWMLLIPLQQYKILAQILTVTPYITNDLQPTNVTNNNI